MLNFLRLFQIRDGNMIRNYPIHCAFQYAEDCEDGITRYPCFRPHYFTGIDLEDPYGEYQYDYRPRSNY